MKTLRQIFEEHDYGNTEWEQSFVPILKEWLNKKRQQHPKYLTYLENRSREETFNELLEELK